MSDHSKSLKSVAQWLTEFVFLLSWPPFMMFSISLNSRNALKCLLRLLNHKPLRLNLIYPTPNNPFRSLIPRRESPEERRLKCIRSYGIITQKKKQLGKLILSSTKFPKLPSSQFPNLITQFHSASESQDEIIFRGEGYDIQVFRI
jgi:hypothetical protein